MAQTPYTPKAQQARNKTVVERYFHGEQELTWSALVQFRLTDGKISEEWVMRDELGMLLQVGPVTIGTR